MTWNPVLAHRALKFRESSGNCPAEPVKPEIVPDEITAIKERLDAIEHSLSTVIPDLCTKLAEAQAAIPQMQGKRPSLGYIVRTVAKSYDFTEAEILSSRRDGAIITPRHVAMYLSVRLTLQSLPTIGRYFKRDHTSIMHARDKIASERYSNEELRDRIAAFEKFLYPQEVQP